MEDNLSQDRQSDSATWSLRRTNGVAPVWRLVGSRPRMSQYFSLKAIRHKETSFTWQNIIFHWGFPGEAGGKASTCHYRICKRCGFDLWVRKISWRRKWQPAPVFLPGEFQGQRSLMGYCPCCLKDSDTTEQLSTWICIRSSTVGMRPSQIRKGNLPYSDGPLKC